MERITGRLVAKFKEQIVALQAARGAVEMTIGGDLDEGTWLGKRRTLSERDEETKASNLVTRSQGSYDISGKCGGNHGFACHKFKCYKCGEKGHVFRDCKKDRMCFHSHQPGHFKPDYPLWEAGGMQAQMSSVLCQDKVEAQEILGIKFYSLV